jgi:hypothetical protein
MSAPQHIGDLILPWSLGHLDTCTVDPSSSCSVSFTRGASHAPQVAFTDMPHEEHSYVAIVGPSCLVGGGWTRILTQRSGAVCDRIGPLVEDEAVPEVRALESGWYRARGGAQVERRQHHDDVCHVGEDDDDPDDEGRSTECSDDEGEDRRRDDGEESEKSEADAGGGLRTLSGRCRGRGIPLL